MSLSVFLLVAFMLLTLHEAQTGLRVFGRTRGVFDERVSRAAYILRHVDWGGFLSHLVKTTGEYLLHEAAHGALIIVRTIERQLTRVVRYLRERRTSLSTLSEPRTSPLTEVVATIHQALRRSRRAKVTEDTTQE